MHTRFSLLLIVVCLLSVFTIHAQSEPDVVRVLIGDTSLGVGNTLIASAEGYFADQNIDAEVVRFTSNSTNSADALTLLLTGEVDVFQSPWTPGLFNALIRGGVFRAVGVASYNPLDTCPYAGYFVRAGQGEDFDVESLRGQPVAISSGIAQYYLDTYLSDFGMSIDDVIPENIPGSARGEAVANGALELGYVSEPQLSLFQRELGVELVVGLNEIIPDSSLAVLLFGQRMLEREDDLAVRYLTAYLQGSRQFNEGPTERNIEIIAPAMEVEPESLLETCWIAMREDGQLNQEFVLDYMMWLNDHELLDSMIDMEDFYDPSYAEEAYARVQGMYPEPEATPGS